MIQTCPQCRCRVVWNGVQTVCVSCSWTERQGKALSAKRADLPRKRPGTRVKRGV